MYEINDFQTFRTLNRLSKAPSDNIFLPLYIFFDVKFSLNMKEQLYSGSNMNGSKDEYDQCGVVKFDTFRTDFLLVHINKLEVSASDDGNTYLHGFTK